MVQFALDQKPSELLWVRPVELVRFSDLGLWRFPLFGFGDLLDEGFQEYGQVIVRFICIVTVSRLMAITWVRFMVRYGRLVGLFGRGSGVFRDRGFPSSLLEDCGGETTWA